MILHFFSSVNLGCRCAWHFFIAWKFYIKEVQEDSTGLLTKTHCSERKCCIVVATATHASEIRQKNPPTDVEITTGRKLVCKKKRVWIFFSHSKFGSCQIGQKIWQFAWQWLGHILWLSVEVPLEVVHHWLKEFIEAELGGQTLFCWLLLGKERAKWWEKDRTCSLFGMYFGIILGVL